MNIVNLTPHTINILRETESGPKEVRAIEPSGQLARLSVTRNEVANVDGIAFYNSVFGEPEDLPEREDNTIHIVSSLFRSGFDRDDLWVPGELVRDADGKPIGCLGLSR